MSWVGWDSSVKVHSSNKYRLSIYVPGSVLGTGDLEVDKTNRCPSFHGVFMQIGGKENKQGK